MKRRDQNLVAVDTSSRVLAIAVRKAKGRVYECHLTGTPRHAENLLGLVTEGLRRLSIKREDISTVIWGMGPGSFTGLRIGQAVLKGLALGLDVRAWGASSLDAIALGASLEDGELVVCLDARRDSLYLAKYQFVKGRMKKVIKDRLVDPAALGDFLMPGTCVTGDALERYEALAAAHVVSRCQLLASDVWYPSAPRLLTLYDDYPRLLTRLTLRQMKPKYLTRPKQAQTSPAKSGTKGL